MATPRTDAWIDDRLVACAAAHSTAPDGVVGWITAQTAARAARVARMQIGSDQSSFLTMLTSIAGVRNAIEPRQSPRTGAAGAATRRTPDRGQHVVDPRVDVSLLTIGDGVTILRQR